MNAIAGKVLLGHKPSNPAVDEEAGSIKDHSPVHHRQPDGHYHSAGQRGNPGQELEGTFENTRTVKRILAAVASNAEFRQTEDARLLGTCELNGPSNVLEVALPGERSLVQGRRGDAEKFHSLTSVSLSSVCMSSVSSA